ncbi:enoyl-CoA hydratase/carnithine racemase [Stackebrandtia albiflava]|uniref:Enoyl-CoA hydratase/carnithine racemase n=2 Tax=Stackebrandtia albiflava TaxID=406432 RepID=A0A562VD91_9ACTN|nr:enoyl-CoA hydratase/carnithine racemase [Stackebrandtia albiflava]
MAGGVFTARHGFAAWWTADTMRIDDGGPGPRADRTMVTDVTDSRDDSGDVRLDVEGPVARVTLCRPDQRNAQTPAMWRRLRDIGRELTGDIRCVIVAGAGAAFSAGLDLSVLSGGLPAELAAMTDEDAEARLWSFQEAFDWLRRPDLVSIAAVQGYAIGAGLQLALACDLRVLATDARLRVGEPGLGLVPDLGGTKRLVAQIGYARAMELCLTSRTVTAQEAVPMGLATVAVAPDELDHTVEDLVLAVLSVPRDAAVETKSLLLQASVNDDSEQLAAERAAQLRLLRARAGAGE